MSSYFGISLVQLIIGVVVFILVTVTIYSCVASWDDQNEEQKALKGYETLVLNAKLLLDNGLEVKDTLQATSYDFRNLQITLPPRYYIYALDGTDTRFTIPECGEKPCFCLMKFDNLPLSFPRKPNEYDYRDNMVKPCELLDYPFTVTFGTGVKPNPVGGFQFVKYWAGGQFFNSFLMVGRQEVFSGFRMQLFTFPQAYIDSIPKPELTAENLCPSAVVEQCGSTELVFDVVMNNQIGAAEAILRKCIGTTCDEGVCYLAYDTPEKNSDTNELFKNYEAHCLLPADTFPLNRFVQDTSLLPAYFQNIKDLTLQVQTQEDCSPLVQSNGFVTISTQCSDPANTVCTLYDDALLLESTNTYSYAIKKRCSSS